MFMEELVVGKRDDQLGGVHIDVGVVHQVHVWSEGLPEGLRVEEFLQLVLLQLEGHGEAPCLWVFGFGCGLLLLLRFGRARFLPFVDLVDLVSDFHILSDESRCCLSWNTKTIFFVFSMTKESLI